MTSGRHIAGFHLTSLRPCWWTLNKIIYFIWDTNMAAMSIVFCVVSWDCVKIKNSLFNN